MTTTQTLITEDLSPIDIRYAHMKGARNPQAKLSPALVQEIKGLLRQCMSQRAIAAHIRETYGVNITQQNISRINTGDTWSDEFSTVKRESLFSAKRNRDG